MDYQPTTVIVERQHVHPTPPTDATPDPVTGATPTPTMDHNMMDMSMPMMSPYLFFKTPFYILFEDAYVTTAGGYVGAIFACIAFAWFVSWYGFVSRIYEQRLSTGKTSLHVSMAYPLSAVLHASRHAAHYFAMLIVMSMNVAVILAVILGHGLGWLSWILLAPKGHLRWLIGKDPVSLEAKRDDPEVAIFVAANQQSQMQGAGSPGSCCAKKNASPAAADVDPWAGVKLCNCNELECGCDPKKCQTSGGCKCDHHTDEIVDNDITGQHK
eukprot:CAMPEP_0184708392 /NCGR_PEP_ID=MMETSP0313-20130426/37750_1 /TAXON_ID=2792 /ORGANISM="Porphyridium aerugineum, Strain SAG 1380-2" /LENGTH=269 /DNA_ID=CAMNT_0027169979 /DNA_START=323 /DNA_END=1132 /DNA_ORIENTATION=-